ncbi:ankyrin repeat domain-containing protein [Endothiovibrio diazotrophicus]
MNTIIRPLLLLLSLLLAACGQGYFDEPPLHDAAMRGDAERVEALLKEGADVNGRNREGATPLHWAAFKGQVAVARVLLAHGAEVNAVTTRGSSPLRLATTHKQTEMIRLLRSRGGRVIGQ